MKKGIRSPEKSGTVPSSPRDQVREWTVEAGQEGPLVQFLFGRLPERKRTDLRRWLAAGQVAVNGATAAPSHPPVQAGDTVAVNATRPFGAAAAGQAWGQLRDPRLRIIHEDDDFLVVDKGPGLLSVGADNQRRRTREGPSQQTAYSLLRAYVKRRDPRAELYILHRLDRDTSGVLAFAKRPELQQALRSNWNSLVRRRQYVAVLGGVPAPPEGTLRSYLTEDSNYDVRSLDAPAPGARLAVTRYATVSSGGGRSLVEFDLETGRKNQIRVHAASLLRAPVLGDPRYGSVGAAGRSPLGRLCLHAQNLTLVNPLTHRLVTFTAAAPPQFAQLVEG